MMDSIAVITGSFGEVDVATWLTATTLRM